jgi:hypothetical protein
MLMLLAMGLLGLMNRSTVSIADKADQAAQMHRARLILSRAFSQILTASPQRSQAQQPPDANAQQRARGAQGVGLDPDEVLDTDPAPRFWLDFDPVHTTTRMPFQGADGLPAATAPQRIEIVLADSPVPSEITDSFVQARRIRQDAERRGMYRPKSGTDAAIEAIPDQDVPDEEAENDDVRAFRGAFELRSQPVPEALSRRSERRAQRWELWWTPLSPTSEASAIRERFTLGGGGAQAGAFRVATDITAFRVRVFENRVWKDRYASLTSNQLPAYIEVDITMAAGTSAHWLFEIGWAVGPEVRQTQSSITSTETTVYEPRSQNQNANKNADLNKLGVAGAGGKRTGQRPGDGSGKGSGTPGKERKE